MPSMALKSSSIAGIIMMLNLSLQPQLLHWTFHLAIADLLTFFVKELEGHHEEKRRARKRHSDNPSVSLKRRKMVSLDTSEATLCLMPH